MIGVVGGSGFIGTRLVGLLRESGQQVRIIDKTRSATYPELTVLADVCEKERLADSLRGCHNVYHLAAEHQDDIKPVSRYYDVNYQGTRNLVEVSENLRISALIFTSTVAVYGLGQGVSSEVSALRPFNDYGKSKLQAEEALEDWARRAPDRRLVIVRLTATFGPGNRGNLYRLIKEIHDRHFVIVGSGQNRKSIAYVGNVAAFLCFCRTLPSGTTVLNYADKPDLTTAELVETVRRALGRPGTGPRVPKIVGFAGGLALALMRERDLRAVPVMLNRIGKFSANTVVETAKVNAMGFRPLVSLPCALAETVAAEFGTGK